MRALLERLCRSKAASINAEWSSSNFESKYRLPLLQVLLKVWDRCCTSLEYEKIELETEFCKFDTASFNVVFAEVKVCSGSD
jgi:hypothetical protein